MLKRGKEKEFCLWNNSSTEYLQAYNWKNNVVELELTIGGVE